MNFCRRRFPSWRLAFNNVLDQMEVMSGILIDPARGTLLTHVKGLRETLEQMPNPGPESRMADLLAAMRVIDKLTAAAAALLASASGAVKNAWDAINGQLKGASLSDPGLWSATEQPTNDYAERLEKASAHLTSDMLVDIGTAAKQLQQTWSAVHYVFSGHRLCVHSRRFRFYSELKHRRMKDLGLRSPFRNTDS
jgi:hypothetical protein